MVDLVFKNAFVLIKVIADSNDINPWKQLVFCNGLFCDYELEDYSFNPFVLTEIIVIRDCNDPTFLSKAIRL